MELSCVTVPRCDKAGTGRGYCSQARASPWVSDATFRSSGTVSVDNEDSPRVVRFRERREHGSGYFLLHFQLLCLFLRGNKMIDQKENFHEMGVTPEFQYI